MKKIIFLLIFLVIIGSLLVAQQNKYETVIKMRTEKEYAARIEKMLEPFIGKNVVVAKLTLKYPTLLKSIIAQFESPLPESDGKITKSKAAIMSQKEIKEEVDETRIDKKDITVYVDKQLDDKMIKFIENSIKEWFRFTPRDRLRIIKKLDLSQETSEKMQGVSSVEQTDSENNQNKRNGKLILFMAIVMIILGIAFLIIFYSGINRIATARHNVNVTGFDKLISAFANMAIGGVSKGSTEQSLSTNKPVPVRLLREKRSANRTSFDFHFLERLSVDSFYNILITLSLEDAAFILGSVSKEYSAKFLEKYSDKVHNILAHLLKKIVKSKHEIEALRKKVFDKFLKVLENEPFAVDGDQEIIHIINNLSAKKSEEVYNEISKINPPLSEKIRDKIFLLEDIKNLSDNNFEFIILSIDHDLLSQFIYVMQEDRELVNKFFKNMTERGKTIIKEDIEMMDELSEKEKEEVVNKFLMQVRKILRYL